MQLKPLFRANGGKTMFLKNEEKLKRLIIKISKGCLLVFKFECYYFSDHPFFLFHFSCFHCPYLIPKNSLIYLQSYCIFLHTSPNLKKLITKFCYGTSVIFTGLYVENLLLHQRGCCYGISVSFIQP